MKNIIQLFTILASIGLTELNAQNISGLYMPKEILQAYNNESRNYNGTPGKNYFQNQTDYAIKAEFFPENKVLKGSEIITFKNNSNDTLFELYFNLFQNFYKQGTAKDYDINSKNIHHGVKIKRIKVNGINIDSTDFWFNSTIFYIPLVNKISPRSTSNIEIEWEQEMPKFKVKRQGTYNKQNFFIAYWYPKLCVYDDIEGWNTIGHKGGAEFYSDYGNFEVEITAPRDYTMWSSGYLNNISDIFNEKFVKRINEAKQTNKNIQIITESDRKENQITKSNAKHTWKFTLNNQTDFAFALSNQYLWDATSTVVDNKRVFVSSAYESTAKNCQKINEISTKSIQYYSKKIPNVIYPDSQLTVFQGGPGGMEFPCIINQQDFENEFETKLVTSHEIGHVYFPFLVGANEQKYGWMDEGLVSLMGGFDFSIQSGDSAYSMFLSLIISKYKEQATAQICDIPIMIVSHNLGEMTNGFVTYQKAITAFYVLYNYLGKEKFKIAITEFINRWKGKHPIPYDLFFTFNQIAGEDLSWFWKPWFFEFGYADLAIGKVETINNEIYINIDNIGNYPIPIFLNIKYKDGTEKTIRKEMNVWKTDLKTITIKIPKADITEININNELIPDYSSKNNYLKL